MQGLVRLQLGFRVWGRSGGPKDEGEVHDVYLGWPFKASEKYSQIGFLLSPIRENIQYPKGLARYHRTVARRSRVSNSVGNY